MIAGVDTQHWKIRRASLAVELLELRNSLGHDLRNLDDAKAANALAKLPSATLPVLEQETGLAVEQLEFALEFLVLQVLVEQDESNYRLASHLREKLG